MAHDRHTSVPHRVCREKTRARNDSSQSVDRSVGRSADVDARARNSPSVRSSVRRRREWIRPPGAFRLLSLFLAERNRKIVFSLTPSFKGNRVSPLSIDSTALGSRVRALIAEFSRVENARTTRLRSSAVARDKNFDVFELFCLFSTKIEVARLKDVGALKWLSRGSTKRWNRKKKKKKEEK